MGVLRLSLSALYDLTLQEFGNAIEGFYDLEEQRQRTEWERTRWAVMIGLQPHVRKGSVKKPQDVARFPWEEERKPTTDGFSILRQMAGK